jgi:hypothetical protein
MTKACSEEVISKILLSNNYLIRKTALSFKNVFFKGLKLSQKNIQTLLQPEYFQKLKVIFQRLIF